MQRHVSACVFAVSLSSSEDVNAVLMQSHFAREVDEIGIDSHLTAIIRMSWENYRR